jgi:hypothetical protein
LSRSHASEGTIQGDSPHAFFDDIFSYPVPHEEVAQFFIFGWRKRSACEGGQAKGMRGFLESLVVVSFVVSHSLQLPACLHAYV